MTDTICRTSMVCCVCDQLPQPLCIDPSYLCKVWLSELFSWLKSPSCEYHSVNRMAFRSLKLNGIACSRHHSGVLPILLSCILFPVNLLTQHDWRLPSLVGRCLPEQRVEQPSHSPLKHQPVHVALTA